MLQQLKKLKRALLSVLLITSTTYVFSQSSFYFNTYNTNDAVIEEISGTSTLLNGEPYEMEVEGTYSIWSPGYWSSPCWSPENAPIYSSAPATSTTGKVGFDPEYIFGLPKSYNCNGRTFPEQTSRIEYSVDNGSTWFHPSTGTAYNTAHKYIYQVIGQGYPLKVRHVSALNSDDYGQLKITLTQQIVCQVSLDFNTYNADDAVTEVLYSVDPLSTGAVYTMLVDGSYSIWDSSYWTGPCGFPDASPKYSSAPATTNTGQVAFDFEYTFASPTSLICSSNPSPPYNNTRIEISTDGGSNWFHPSTAASYNTNHTYTYSVTGQGYPLLVRHNSALNSDDYGVLKFNLYACGVPRMANFTPSAKKEEATFRVFPNPVKNQLNIQTDTESVNQLRILNLSGQEQNVPVISNGSIGLSLDVSNLPVGVYFVSITINGEVQNHKFIKQ